MTDFRFYLNRQGIRGQKGEKGETGFSPSIVEEVNTLTDYRLKIINEFDEFVTDNLRGSDYFDITDPNGTYLRFDKESGRAYTGALDQATSEVIGAARLATNEDMETFSENTIVTPALFADSLVNLIVSPDGSLDIMQNEETSRTEITFNSATLDAIRAELNRVKEDLATESQVRLNADSQQQVAIDAERRERETQDAALQTQLNSKLAADNIKQGSNITITKNGNNVTISSSGGVVIDDNTPSTNKVFSSSKTSDLVGELGNEVNSIAGRLNNLEGEVKVATTENLGLVQPDGTTITIDSDGKISAVGGGSGDVTAAGDNVFTGNNSFATKISIYDKDHPYDSWTGKYDSLKLQLENNTATIHRIGGITFKSDLSPSSTGIPASLSMDTIQFRLNGTNIGIGDQLFGSKIEFSTTVPIKVLAGIAGDTSIIPQLKDFKEGSNITLVKNEETGEITISATGGGTPEVDNVTIEVNEEGKLQTTVDINELQAKVEDLQLYKFPNATIIGTPTINNGQITDFSTTNYLQFPFEFKSEGRTWLLNGSFDTSSNVTTQQNIIDSLASVALAVRNGRLVLALSTNGTSFNLDEHESMSDIEANTKYYFRLSFSGSQYLLSLSTDKEEWMPEIIVTSSDPIASKTMTISSAGHPYGGVINLNDWNLTVANTLVWQGMDDVGIASRMDVNMSNMTEAAKQVIKDIAGGGESGDIEEALRLLNGGDSTLLDTKLNKDLTNLDNENKSTIASFGFPSNRSVDLQLGASGASYTAPANGYYTLAVTSSGNNIIYIYRVGDNRYGYSSSASNGQWQEVYLPVIKGDNISIQYNAISAVNFFRFIYAEGSKEDN